MSDKKMLSDYPHLLREWDHEKNVGLSSDNYRRGSDKVVWWRCSKLNHSWDMPIGKRTLRNYGCPYCANKRVLKGYNDVASTHPLILDYWDFERNTELSLYELTKFSRKEAFFKCSCGYRWKKKVCNFVNNKGKCDSCSEKIVSERNSLIINCPDLINEWDYEKNVDLDINSFTIGMNRNVWWRCLKGHSWRAKIAGRVANKHSCPYCSNSKILAGYNDLATTHPEIIKYWDYEKNSILNIDPIEVSYGSDKKVWWKCDLGHSFQSTIKSRVYNNSGCSICSNRLIVSGINDVLTVFPQVLNMIDNERTKVEELKQYSKGSNKVIWWKCNNGHKSWSASLKTRLISGSGCPACSGAHSQMENDFCDFVSSVVEAYINAEIIENSRKVITPYELDVYIPALNLAFEFNGDYWHSDEHIMSSRGITADEYHNRKLQMCAKKGIELFFIWESDWLNKNDETKERVEATIMSRLTN